MVVVVVVDMAVVVMVMCAGTEVGSKAFSHLVLHSSEVTRAITSRVTTGCIIRRQHHNLTPSIEG
jgi:hypothetical protein